MPSGRQRLFLLHIYGNAFNNSTNQYEGNTYNQNGLFGLHQVDVPDFPCHGFFTVGQHHSDMGGCIISSILFVPYSDSFL